MDKIASFVSTLLPSLEKSMLLAQLDDAEDVLLNCAIPSYAETLDAGLFGPDYVIKTTWLKNKENQFGTPITIRGKSSIVSQIYMILQRIEETLKFLRQLADKEYQSVVSRDGLTYPMANIVLLSEHLGFAVNYANAFLLAVYGHEMQAIKALGRTALPYAKPDMDYIETRFAGFVSTMNVLGKATSDVKTSLAGVIDVVVDHPNDSKSAVVAGINRTNPLQLGFLPYQINPIYHIRMAWVDWQHSQYKRNKEIRQALIYRLNQMKLAQEGKQDASTAKLIEQTEGRILKLSASIADMERKANV